MNKNKFILMFAVVSCIGSKAIAADVTTHDYHTGQYPVAESVKNSIIYGHDTNVTQAHGHLSGIIAGGENNTVQLDAHNSATFGISNNNNSANSVVAGDHNTITNANNSIAGGIYNASHSSNTLVFGYNNAIDFQSDNSFAGGERAKLTGKNSFVFGEDAKVENDNVYAIGKEAQAMAENTVTIGNKAQATINDSVALGSYSITNTIQGTSSTVINDKTYTFAGGVPVGTVSIGDANKERTITNVAAGQISDVSTDAINGSQLHAVVTEVTNNTNSIKDLDNKIIDVASSTIKETNQYTDSQVAHVGAQSAALAGLHPLDFNKDDKASYAASVGRYRNANAVAIGAFYRPNERTMVSGAVSFGKHIQMNLGVAFKTGKGSEYINEAKSKDSRIEKLEALVEKLTAEVAELKANK